MNQGPEAQEADQDLSPLLHRWLPQDHGPRRRSTQETARVAILWMSQPQLETFMAWLANTVADLREIVGLVPGADDPHEFSFDELLRLVSEGIRRDDTNYRMAISPRLVVTLRYLATGASYASLHFEFRLGKSTISYFVPDTCSKKIWSVLLSNYMAMPTKEKWREISNTFMEKTQCPNCLGAIDGKHIRMVMPPASGSRYFNYKKFFSIVLMAVADANYNLISVDVGSFGSAPNSSVFQHSEFYKQLSQGQLEIPEPRPLPASDPDFPMVFVADEAFAISNNLMRPYSSRSLDEKRTNFNYRLSMARRTVECTFGILANKCCILQ
ncbi:LOW QUALITY PROTEIN: uncharacterized protein ACMZJ9_021255 [Mantella aurantiaca]